MQQQFFIAIFVQCHHLFLVNFTFILYLLCQAKRSAAGRLMFRLSRLLSSFHIGVMLDTTGQVPRSCWRTISRGKGAFPKNSFFLMIKLKLSSVDFEQCLRFDFLLNHFLIALPGSFPTFPRAEQLAWSCCHSWEHSAFASLTVPAVTMVVFQGDSAQSDSVVAPLRDGGS